MHLGGKLMQKPYLKVDDNPSKFGEAIRVIIDENQKNRYDTSEVIDSVILGDALKVLKKIQMKFLIWFL
jgi:tRNA A37 threonylcarbamoyladenosine synthetase subunit TsaC/SUA5/YrdC